MWGLLWEPELDSRGVFRRHEEGALARGGNLDTRTIEAARPRAATYRLSDGGGLLLIVKPSGAKVWVARVTVAGRRRDMGLGGFPTVSLRQAREKAAAARKQSVEGLDPIAERERLTRERQAQRKASIESELRTFRNGAIACIEAEAPGWKNRRTELLWQNSLQRW